MNKYPPQPKITPPTGDDLPSHWGFATFKDKTILDLGADRGSTVWYFFSEGAEQIIAIEGDPALYAELENNYGRHPFCHCIHLMITQATQIESLIRIHKPDLVKIDVEGAEIHLLGVPREVLTTVQVYLIETHDPDIHSRMVHYLSIYGYYISEHYQHPGQGISVIYATKFPR